MTAEERAIKLLDQQDPLLLSVSSPYRTSLAGYRAWELAENQVSEEELDKAVEKPEKLE